MREFTWGCACVCVLAGTMGCGGGDRGPTKTDPSGLNLPPLTSAQIRIVGPEVEAIAPGADVTDCTYLDWYADKDYDIVESIGRQSASAAHHVVAFGVATNKPPGTAPCTESDMINATTFLGGGGAASAPLKTPSGVAIRLTKGTQVMVQHHWINTGTAPVNGAYAIDLTIADGASAMQQAGMFLAATTTFSLPPQVETTASSDCVVQESLNVFMLAGHAHELGKHVVISRTGADGIPVTLYDSGPWSQQYMFDPPRNNYTSEAPLVFSPGDHVSTTCTWANTTADTVTFPTEMCFTVAYYYPSTGNVTCMDGVWSHAAASTL